MPILYDGKKIIPAGYIAIAEDVERKGDASKRRNVFAVTLTGTIHAFKGSPNSAGEFWELSGYPADETPVADNRQTYIQNKIGALTELFQTENRWFEAQGWDGAQPIKFQARLRSMNFDAGPWFDICRYTITFETECIFFGSRQICAANNDNATEESWEIEVVDENQDVYRLTHNVSAQFPNLYSPIDGSLDSYGWMRAQTAVMEKLYEDAAASSIFEQDGVLALGSHQAFNHNRQVSQLESEGIYRVSETWIGMKITEGTIPARENYNIDIQEQSGILTCTISGTIEGLFSRDSDFHVTTTKLERAQAKWAEVMPILFTRAQSATERILNPVAITRQKTQEITNGVITYSFVYNTRSNFGIDAMSVSITAQDIHPTDVFAGLTIINRLVGPLFQPIGTVTQRQRNLTIDVILNPVDYSTTVPPTMPDVSAIVLYYMPVASQVFLVENNESIVLDQGKYTRVVSWVYQ